MATPVLVDVHMHLYESKTLGAWWKERYQIWEYGAQPPSVRFSRYGGDLQDALRAMTDGGFSRAVSVNLFARDLAREEAIFALPAALQGSDREKAIAEIDRTMPERLRAYNRWACDLVAGTPIAPYIGLDPWVLSPEEGARHLRDMVEHHGARGIKLHPVVQRFRMDDERMLPIYRAAVDLGVAVLAHSGPARSGEPYGEPRAFGEVLRRFPDLTLVMAHLGGGAWRQTLEVAQTYPNARFDLCEIIEWTGAQGAPSGQDFARLIREIGADRVMLGTDFPWYDLDATADRVRALPILSQEEKEGILGQNAVRILRL
jgi:predicted TIM-barrel fold metal-dependent hydrolase